MTEIELDKHISAMADEAYRRFSCEPLVQSCGGVDRASYCCGYDEGYRAALKQAEESSQ